MVKITNLNKVRKEDRIFLNPDKEQKEKYTLIKKEIEKKYSIQLSNRNYIIKQLIATLTQGDHLNSLIPSINLMIIRTDIKNFFPSVNKHKLYKKLKSSNLLYRSTFNELQSIFFTKSIEGIPLGLPFSNVLAEVYLEQFDNDILYHFNPTFYFRYVDDIIIINYLDNFNFENKKIMELLSNIFKSNSLQINQSKTIISRYINQFKHPPKSHFSFSYLGYYFESVENESDPNKKDGKLKISIAEKKFKKIVNNIKSYFYLYKKSKQTDRDFWMLYYRLVNSISGVTSTDKNSKIIKFGLGYTYGLINNENQMDTLIIIIKGLIHSLKLNSRKRSTLLNIFYYKDNSLEILSSRINYTKLTPVQLKKIKCRLRMTTESNNISRVFYTLYKGTHLELFKD
ncbi:RNA-directed DNA polymerase [Aerococcus urinaeequi]|uniref:RNA-directed DNA polymerase n=1 Tax=Aerococcus urinaeequi TaxID=51665 RepID=UPI000845F9D1|nr:RNA-directed DNA polymerase [Aerococcus urinaeequi]